MNNILMLLFFRVLDIMKRDAQRDPAEFPDAVRARVLVNQVSC